ncbi:MAG: hypothetical protein N2517_04845 [Ignavibacteria bacterium]|nr:hypothetical protein [Ignavibacteria bacterium]
MKLFTHKQDACATFWAVEMSALPFGEAGILLLLRATASAILFHLL